MNQTETDQITESIQETLMGPNESDRNLEPGMCGRGRLLDSLRGPAYLHQQHADGGRTVRRGQAKERKAGVNYTTELERYRRYQEKAFGAVVYDWPDDRLAARREELDRMDLDRVPELTSVRIKAERTALMKEVARRAAERMGRAA